MKSGQNFGWLFRLLKCWSAWLSGEDPPLPVQETQEMQVQFLGREDPLEEEMVIHSSILDWKIPWTGSLEGYSPWGRQESALSMHAHVRNSEERTVSETNAKALSYRVVVFQTGLSGNAKGLLSGCYNDCKTHLVFGRRGQKS